MEPGTGNEIERQVVWGKNADRTRITEHLQDAIDRIPLRHIFLAEKPEGQSQRGPGIQMTPVPRLLLVLSGRMHIVIWSEGKQQERILDPGDMIFCQSYSWTRPYWDLHHEMISLIFYKTYLRGIYLHHCTDQTFPEPDYYFHTRHPIRGRTFHLLQALSLTTGQTVSPKLLKLLLSALLEMSLAELNETDTSEQSKADLTRQRILDYIQSNSHLPINRESTANALSLTPTYLSRLLSNFDGKSFNAHLTDCRMQRAEELLEQSELTVDEIAYLCGYRYTSYFIAVFEKFHRHSPYQYRTAKREERLHPE